MEGVCERQIFEENMSVINRNTFVRNNIVMMFVQTARCKGSAVGKKFWLCAVDIAFMNFPPTGQYFNEIVACSYMKNSFSIDLHRNFHGILTM